MGEKYEIHKADIRDWCKSYDGPKFHAALMDPPYHLGTGDRGFMGKHWDGGSAAFQAETWAGIMEHLHPGAFLMAYGGTRTYHRMAVAIEDAGFVLHSAMVYAFGSGFPKSTRIDDQVDAAAGAEREVVGWDKARISTKNSHEGYKRPSHNIDTFPITAPATPLAATWQGHRYGRQALKPAAEFICVAQKPYVGRPVDCITQTGAGALWIDGGRVGADGDDLARNNLAGDNGWKNSSGGPNGAALRAEAGLPPQGRWPANLILSDDAAARLDAQSGELTSGEKNPGGVRPTGVAMNEQPGERTGYFEPSTGGASRFFHVVSEQIDAADPLYYSSKASTWERNAGLAGLPQTQRDASRNAEQPSMNGGDGNPYNRGAKPVTNHHPTVKPLDLNRYLATLLLPPKEYAPRRILIPFFGVASEMIGALLAGWDYAEGVERDDDGGYIDIGKARLRYWTGARRHLTGTPADVEGLPLLAALEAL